MDIILVLIVPVPGHCLRFTVSHKIAVSDGFNDDIFVIIIPIALDTFHCLVHETYGSR